MYRVLEQAATLGFLGEAPVDDQVDHALGFVAAVEEAIGIQPRAVLDLGSGGGLPGLVVACCWPDARIVLVDANERRTRFLSEVVVGPLPGTPPVEVIRGRTEVLGREGGLRECFDLVTSRSFGRPAVTAENGSSFLEVGGWLVVSEPPDVPSVVRWPTAGLATVGLTSVAAIRPPDRFGYQILRKSEPISDRYPRRTGIPTKRPIF